MNKTDKEIIDLIESFMNKALSDGCYISMFNKGTIYSFTSYFRIISTSIDRSIFAENCFNPGKNIEVKNKLKQDELGIAFKDGKYTYHRIRFKMVNKYGSINESDMIEHYKILGHYEITAIEKYIIGQSNFDYIESECCKFNYKIFYDRNGRGEDIKVLRKPLNVYSEEEKKDLLKILLELKIK